jgi:tetratricopeptide (TPR) repeat protein
MKLQNLIFCCVLGLAAAGVVFSQDVTATEKDFEEGSRFYLARDFKQAIPPYERALVHEQHQRRLKKEFWTVLVDNLSMAYGMTGDLDNSRKVLEYGIGVEPTYPMFYYILACNFGEKGEEGGAVENLRLAFKYRDNMIAGEPFPDVETDSSFAGLMKRESFRKAVAEMKGGMQPAARTDTTWGCGERDYKCQLDSREKALKAEPKNPESWYNIALVYLRSGNAAVAVQTFDMYLAIPGVKPDLQADGYNNRGMAYKQLKRYDLAYADYTKAIELNPKCAVCLTNRGNVDSDLKRPGDAIADYNRAIAADPKYALAYANRGHLFASQDKNDDALKDLAIAINLDRANPEPYYTRAMVYRAKRNFAAAIPDLNDYIDRMAGNDQFLADAYLNRAIAYAMTNKPDQAEKDVSRAIELAPDYVDAYKTRAVIYRDAKKMAEAEADEKKAAELSSKQPR